MEPVLEAFFGRGGLGVLCMACGGLDFLCSLFVARW